MHIDDQPARSTEARVSDPSTSSGPPRELLDGRRDRSGAITAQRRDMVRTAAAEVFAARGYHGASLREVATAAGLAQGHLYYYYSTKQDLLYKVIAEMQMYFNELSESLASQEGTPEQRLEHLLTAHVRILCVHREEATVSYENMRFLPPEQRTHIVEMRDRYEVGLIGLIDACRETGPVSKDPSNILAKIILGVVNWPYQWYRDDGSMSVDDLARILAQRSVASLYT